MAKNFTYRRSFSFTSYQSSGVKLPHVIEIDTDDEAISNQQHKMNTKLAAFAVDNGYCIDRTITEYEAACSMFYELYGEWLNDNCPALEFDNEEVYIAGWLFPPQADYGPQTTKWRIRFATKGYAMKFKLAWAGSQSATPR